MDLDQHRRCGDSGAVPGMGQLQRQPGDPQRQYGSAYHGEARYYGKSVRAGYPYMQELSLAGNGKFANILAVDQQRVPHFLVRRSAQGNVIMLGGRHFDLHDHLVVRIPVKARHIAVSAAALSASLPFAKAMGGVSASIGLGAALLCAGVLVYLVYCVMDKKEDASAAAVATEPEEGFKFSDLGGLFKTTGFWYVAFLCLMFYAGVFPFLKFATKLMIFKYGVDANLAGLIPAMLPFGTIFLTPLFGSIYDKYGKGATLMIIGSCLLTFVHVMFALPINSWVLAIVLMLILGIAFGLVPSAMWPSVPKIIPMKLLGTAYALIFYIQNIGLALIPVWIGKVNQANTGADGVIDYTQTMTIFAAFGVIAIIISFLLLFEDKRKGYGLQKPNVK